MVEANTELHGSTHVDQVSDANISVEDMVTNWVTQYKAEKLAAVQKLINFVIRVAILLVANNWEY